MTLVAGVDSSTQSCKVSIHDAESGDLVREGRAGHPEGTEVDPEAWWTALHEAVRAAGGLDDVDAVSVAGQQHGMVVLDADGEVIRPAMLWNDTRSAQVARDLAEDRGAEWWATNVGSVPVASLTVTKLAWLAQHEPDHARRVAAVCLPHDWLTWRLRAARAVGGHGLPSAGSTDLSDLVTDRSDASGTGYWSPATGAYLTDLVEDVLGHVPLLPRVAGPAESIGTGRWGTAEFALAPGAGDNAAAALGLGARTGTAIVSIGTSGVVSAVQARPTSDPTGLVAGFADATGQFLPLACTLNAARVLDAMARVLGVDHNGLDQLA